MQIKYLPHYITECSSSSSSSGGDLLPKETEHRFVRKALHQRTGVVITNRRDIISNLIDRDINAVVIIIR
jgi:hypothetical protein